MGTSNCQSKPRIVSTPSERNVPDGAPKWAVNVEDTCALDDTTAVLQTARRTLNFEDSSSSTDDSS